MRLHSLELSAFGPYREPVSVDFDALADGGLFLLHGETGSGKTSLLDAVAFALFGTVPGARGQVRRLRCDAADPGTPTRVSLELSVGGRRLRITRSPEYARPKARGTGLTTEKARVSLSFVDDPSAAGLSSHREVGDVVGDLLGMSADQFFQVVLLPQGEFAQFLRSDTAERERLLERLFDTGRFARVEDLLAHLRRESGRAVAEARSDMRAELARWEQASGLSLPADLDPIDGPDLSSAVARLRELAAAAVASAGATRLQRAAAQSEWEHARYRAGRVQTVRELLVEADVLSAGEIGIADQRIALDAAGRAEPVVQAFTRRQAASRADEAALAEVTRNHTLLLQTLDRFGAGDASAEHASVEHVSLPPVSTAHLPGGLTELAAADRDRAGALTTVIAEALEQTVEQNRLRALVADEADVRDELTTVETDGSRYEHLLVRLRTESQQVASVAAELPALELELSSAQEVLAAVSALPTAALARERSRSIHTRAVDDHQDRRAEHLHLLQARIDGMAGELASGLADGDACPVCGAADHPRLAGTEGSSLAGTDVNSRAVSGPAPDPALDVRGDLMARIARAEGAERIAGASRQAAEQRSRLADEQHSRLVDATRGTDANRAAQQTDELLRRRGAATAAARRQGRLADEIRSAEKRIVECSALQRELVGRRSALVSGIDIVQRQLERRSNSLEQARAGFRSVVDHRDALLALAAAREASALCHERRLQSAERLLAEDRALAAQIEAAGFGSCEQALSAASLDAAGVRREIREHEDRRLALSGRLADPKLLGVDPAEQIDVPAARATADAAIRLADEATAHEQATRATAEAAADSAAAVERVRRRIVPILARDSGVAALADTIAGRGQNSKGISLRAFVLSTRLRQVAEVASARLLQMSSGRYSFLPSTDKEGRGRSGGLGLDIQDAHTGVARPVKTLSGGESFLASLALALGLADVVAAESGGRVLDTIFIDEGFGTLDADALELVMDTLDELRSGGRIVGLVSHVGDLQTRIPTRLHIRRTTDGPFPQLVAG